MCVCVSVYGVLLSKQAQLDHFTRIIIRCRNDKQQLGNNEAVCFFCVYFQVEEWPATVAAEAAATAGATTKCHVKFDNSLRRGWGGMQAVLAHRCVYFGVWCVCQMSCYYVGQCELSQKRPTIRVARTKHPLHALFSHSLSQTHEQLELPELSRHVCPSAKTHTHSSSRTQEQLEL